MKRAIKLAIKKFGRNVLKRIPQRYSRLIFNNILENNIAWGQLIVDEWLVKNKLIVCSGMLTLGHERKEYVFQNDAQNDYIRMSSLELIAKEIYDNNIDGSVAELGVFKGDFSKAINVAFPDRKLYLFDTFNGFDGRDVKIEFENKYSTAYNDFSGTDVQMVLAKMKIKENCIIKKGYFPESASGIDDNFAFVSIDVDLYEPMYNGLKYFYSKLTKGGYILLHDYNNISYNGVKMALKKFSRERHVPYFPICDNWGSAVIMKM